MFSKHKVGKETERKKNVTKSTDMKKEERESKKKEYERVSVKI